MLQPNLDPAPTTVRIHRYGYVSRCKARGCLKRATLIAEKVDCAGRHLRQTELCAVHQIVIERERARAGLRSVIDENLVDARSKALKQFGASDSAIRRIIATMEPLLALKSKAEENAETL